MPLIFIFNEMGIFNALLNMPILLNKRKSNFQVYAKHFRTGAMLEEEAHIAYPTPPP